jgi:uncharacterized membrane-anchored protein YjiN (DUF445 family)
MKNNKIKKLIKDSILKLIEKTRAGPKRKEITSKHEHKIHFIPIQYRIFSGLLQSLNIQFGNFLEVLLQKIIAEEKQLKIIDEFSGKKNIKLSVTKETNSLIDGFISDRKNNSDNQLSEKFDLLLEKIINAQQSDKNLSPVKQDVDILFQNWKKDVYYYVELKYNDDHDTGKFVSINRKFLRTYAGLVKKLGIKNTKQLKPILYYFNRKIMKGNIYVPEKTHIYRGEQFFKEFLTVQYDDIDKC